MRWKTHLAFALLCGLFLFKFFKIPVYLFFPLVLFGALLPDLDTPQSKIGKKVPLISKLANFLLGHRGIFHSVLFLALLYFAFSFLIGKWYALALALGYLSHLVIDGFTIAGINYLNPIAKLHVSGFIETGTFSETILLFILIGLDIIKIYGLII